MRLDDLTMELSHLVTPPGHLFVHSGRTTVQPLERTAAGVGAFYSPPVAAHGVKLTVTLLVDDAVVVTDTGSWGKGDVGMLYQGGQWHADRIVRRGTWNHYAGGTLRSLALTSTLVPLTDAAGYVLRLELANRADRAVRLQVHPRLEPGMVEQRPLSAWVFGLPRAGDTLVQTAPGRFRGHGLEIALTHDPAAFTLGPGQSRTTDVVVTAGPGRAPAASPADAAARIDAAHAAWERRVQRHTRRLPSIESAIPGLVDYYHRSVASGLVCIWDDPCFVTRPFLATSGMDGGAICTYLWDLGGYVPLAATLLMGEDMPVIAESLSRVPLDSFFAITPDGTPTGNAYSYSVFAFTSLAWAVCTLLAPREDLYREARRLFDAAEASLPRRGELIDYGTQREMLEMRGSGWEHVVASPNAERAWCLERLADMGEHFLTLPAAEARAQRAAAERIRAAIRAELWDPARKWFRAVFPDGHVEIAHSIQAFDALRAGACDPAMEAALLEKVAEGAFLGSYGVSSVSRTDPVHYEWNDPDWSGAGAYTGDPPALALTLYERGHDALGWDVLKRLFWMGRHLPYFPQEHRCDVPQTLAHKRANCVSGLGGAEAIVFGLTGLRVGLDGAMTLRPCPPPDGPVSLAGLRVRDTVLDVHLSPGAVRVLRDGARVYEGPPREISLPPG